MLGDGGPGSVSRDGALRRVRRGLSAPILIIEVAVAETGEFRACVFEEVMKRVDIGII